MGEHSEIEWTEATFNPWWGCAHVSPGCVHCYAETWAKRTGQNVWGKLGERRTFGDSHWAEPFKWNRKAEKRGEPMLVFCASMADVFEPHPALNHERERLWDLIETTPWLVWQLLTKRPEEVRAMVPPAWLFADVLRTYEGTERRISGWPSNVWIGTSVEDQQRADERIPALLEIPAGVRFLSCEPLLAPVDLSRWLHLGAQDRWHDRVNPLEGVPTNRVRWRCSCGEISESHEDETVCESEWRDHAAAHLGLHWVICGGESGPQARPMHPDWARAIRDQATAAGVPFLFKQHGEWLDGRRLGKKAAGRLLDGRTWDEKPAKILPASACTSAQGELI